MNHSAENGHLSVLEYLHSKPRAPWTEPRMAWNDDASGCSIKGAWKAAENGHLHIVEWLHTHYHYGGDQFILAINFAAQNGHLNTVEWLHANCQNWNENNADGSLFSSELLHSKWPYMFGVGLDNRDITVDVVAKNGHLDILEWIHDHYPSAECSLMKPWRTATYMLLSGCIKIDQRVTLPKHLCLLPLVVVWLLWNGCTVPASARVPSNPH